MKTRFLCIVALSLALASQAATIYWTNPGESAWSDPNNWISNALPATNDEVRINNGGTALIDSSQNITGYIVTVGDTNNTSGKLRMTGGSLTTSSDIRVGGNSATGGGSGIFDQLDGTVLLANGNFNVGYGTNASGIYNLSGGSLQMNAGTPIFAVGNRGVGVLNQSNGTIYLRATNGLAQLGRNVAAGTGFGTYNLSGGTLASTRLAFGNATGTGAISTNTFNLSGTGTVMVGSISNLNTTAVNTFNFTGGKLLVMTNAISLTNAGGILSPATIDFTSLATNIASLPVNPIGTTLFPGTNCYVQGPYGTLAIDIAGPASHDNVDIGAGTPIASADVAGTIAVNLLNNFSPEVGATFDILTADAVTFSGRVLSAQGGAFSASVVTGGDSRQVLRLTVTSQPVIAIHLSEFTVLPNGAFQFRFTNATGKLFSVLGGDLTSWTYLGNATEISAGLYQFTDLQASAHPNRFYRVRW